MINSNFEVDKCKSEKVLLDFEVVTHKNLAINRNKLFTASGNNNLS